MKLIIGLLFIAQLGGCAVMSKSDCFNGSWQREGYGVGFDGNRDMIGAFNKRAEICAKHGAVADLQAFERGHYEGIEKYCEIPNAAKLGTRGRIKAINEQICPEEEYIGFEAAFNAGYRLYELRRQEDEARHRLNNLQEQKYRIQRERSQLRNQAKSSELTEQQRKYAARQSRYINRDIRSIQSSIYHYRNLVYKRKEAADNYEHLLEIEYGEGRPSY